MTLDVLSRFFHVATAIVLVGGTFFTRFVLLPAASQLPEAEHLRLRELVLGRWKKVVHLGILLLLLTGFYNYFQATPAAEFKKQYHMLVGIKILIAFAVFGLASVLVGRSAAAQRLRLNPQRPLGLLLLLGLTVVAISSYLRVSGTVALRAEKSAPGSSATTSLPETPILGEGTTEPGQN